MHHRTAVLGSPGTGKSTLGLSYPGVEQHVFGSSEEDTAQGFAGRKDILPPVKYDWFETLTDAERAKFTDEKVTEQEVAGLTELARCKNIIRYRRYLYGLKSDLLADKRPELKSIFLDNFTPFSQDFEDYVRVVYAKDFLTNQGNFDTIKFVMRYQQEVTDFLRFFLSLPCHTVVSCHVTMTVDEETAGKVNFIKDQKEGIRHPKEWQPLVMGRMKYVFAALFTHAFFLDTEESAGQPTKYYAKLEADTANVGVAKGRIQPFKDPKKIYFPRGRFFPVFEEALQQFLATGQLVDNPR